MWPRTHALHHASAPLLQGYATKGCPVNCGNPWTQEQIEAAFQNGSHSSALTQEARKFLRAETLEKVQQGFVHILKYRDIKKVFLNILNYLQWLASRKKAVISELSSICPSAYELWALLFHL
jgi:hypothetical protein